MTSSGHTRSLVGQIEHLWWWQCRDLCTRSWANGLGGGSAQLLGTRAVRCWATAVRNLGNQALLTRRRQQEQVQRQWLVGPWIIASNGVKTPAGSTPPYPSNQTKIGMNLSLQPNQSWVNPVQKNRDLTIHRTLSPNQKQPKGLTFVKDFYYDFGERFFCRRFHSSCGI